MMKRTLSLLLALIMVVGLVPVSFVQAAENNDVFYVDESTSMSDLVDKGLVQMDQPVTEPIMPETPTNQGLVTVPDLDTPVQESEEPEQTPDAPALTACDCGMEDADIYNHSDNCALRLYYYQICAGTAAQIYDLWRNVSQVTRGFLEDYLAANYPEKLPEVLKLRDSGATPDDSQKEEESASTRLPGEASTTVDGVTLDALGVPEGSSLTVTEPSAETKELVEEIVASGEERDPEQLFFYDISVQNDESSDWQPDGTSVELKLSIPGKKLNQYTEVRIIHVDDEGNDSLIKGVVDENGDIVFETGGFSTFAGFTVDFTFGSAMVSIPGKTSTTLGTLFKEMKMPLSGADVVDVQFTDYSLLTVTKEENDWRLTSLKAFSTHETLTFTMADGNTYEFMVTDAQYAQVQVGADNGYETDDNGYTRWFADADGNLNATTGTIAGNWRSYYWSKNAIVYIKGPGEFTIAIQPNGDMSRSATECYVNMKQVRVLGGAKVRFYIGTHFVAPDSDTYSNTTRWSKMQTVVLKASQNESLFYVEDGTLWLEGLRMQIPNTTSYQTIQLKLEGYLAENTTTATAKPLVSLQENCTRFVADRVVFTNSAAGGVFSRSKWMTLFHMTNCSFESSVHRKKYYDTDKKTWGTMNGGAIYMNEGTATVKNCIDYFFLNNCTFDGNEAGSHGGAIYLGDQIRMGYIKGCTFKNTSSGGSGGAICMRATMGQFHVYRSTFTDCTAKKDGGGITCETVKTNGETMYSRVYEILLNETTFTRCKATGEHSEENDGIGGGVNLTVQAALVRVKKCTFDSCEAQGNATNLAGGGVAFGYANLGDTGDNPTGEMSLPWTPELKYHSRNGNGYLKDADGNVIQGTDADDPEIPSGGILEPRHDTNNKRVILGEGTFRDGHQGWFMEEKNDAGEVTNTYWRQRTTFGRVVFYDNTVFMNNKNTIQGGGFIVRTGCSIEDLDVTDTVFDGNQVADKGSAVFFNNCIVATADFNNCTFKNNKVTDSIYSGGGTFRTVGQTSSKMTIDGCKFLDNAANQAGGGIYWNAGQTRKTCEGNGGETKAIIKNCEFRRNTAVKPANIDDTDDNGNVINLSRYGGGIFCETVMTVESCIFDGNKSEIGGGLCMGVYNATYRMFNDNETTQLVLDSNTEFFHNEAVCGGGLAIRANATLAIDNDDVKNHTVAFTLGGAKVYENAASQHGGGIYYVAEHYEANPNKPEYDPSLDNAEVARYIKNINLDSGTVYSNSASRHGGGIYVESSHNTTVTVSNATLYYNNAGVNVAYTHTNTGEKDENDNDIYTTARTTYAQSDDGGNGGAIYLTGSDAVVNITGGIIGGFMQDDKISGAVNTAYGRTANPDGGYGGGLALYGGANLSITGGHIIYNDAERDGGGISVNDNAQVTMTGGFIQYNEADKREQNSNGVGKHKGVGGGIALNEASMICYGGTIQWNKGYHGGGISLKGGASLKMEPVETEVEGETVTTYGLVDANSANQWGGGIYLASADSETNKNTLTIKGGTVSNNTATKQNGGGIYVGRYDTMEMTGGEVTNNSTPTWGGGIYVGELGSKATLTGGKIYSNHADTGNGGAICAQNYAYVKVDGCEIYSNTAQTGGGIFATFSDVDIESGKLYNNTATSIGGAVSITAGSTVDVIGGEIYGNTAIDGGGFYICNFGTNKSFLTVQDGKIYGNTASNNGGGINLNASNATISGGEIYGNSAHSGGAIFLINDEANSLISEFEITDGKIHENSAVFDDKGQYGSGGAIYAWMSKVTLNGGEVYKNHAMALGGAVYTNKTEFILKDGKVYGNRATNLLEPDADGAEGNGGALYIYEGSASIEGGEMTGNMALMHGGAANIYNATVNISEGIMSDNAATYGGALFLNRATTTITGGTIGKTEDKTVDGVEVKGYPGNRAHQGGGIFVRSGTTNINGGTIIGNTVQTYEYLKPESNQHGGGITVDNHGDGDACILTINGGEIIDNTAPQGGGIRIKNVNAATGYNVTCVIEGGDIINNTSTGDGGGIYIDSDNQVAVDADGNVTDVTKLTVNGGKIYGNKALSGNGGGICAVAQSQVFINGTQDKHGEIDNNTAKNGGGVYVTTGADLTVTDGHITNNKSLSPADAVKNFTGFWGDTSVDDLHGVGGGICVTDGNSGTVPSTFTLTGTNVAIYGNQADFAGDDVFSNGHLTKLDVPTVATMNLAGYGFKPEGWFEDYNEGDYCYLSGLNMIIKNGGELELDEDSNYVNVYRYRKATAVDRRFMHIKPQGANGENYVLGSTDATYAYVNKQNAYVAMTLGIPAAADDTVVIDYGNIVSIDVWENDLFMDEADFANTKDDNDEDVHHSYLYNVSELPSSVQEKDGVYYNINKPTTTSANHFYENWFTGSTNGRVDNLKNGIVTFNPKEMTMDKEASFYYMVEHNGVWYYANVTVVPATTIYYEDNMSQVKYHNDADSKESLATWESVGDETDGTQAQDRPGAAMLDGLDADNIYGYDGSYTTTGTYSNGSAHWVQASRHNPQDNNGDGTCDLCKKKVSHSWLDANGDGICDTCGVTCTHHCQDAAGDGKCDTCQREMEHKCIDNTAKKNYCDICGISMGTHTIAARATFTFTGTGFDIVGLCNKNTGIVMVSVYEGEVVDFDNPPYDRYVASYMVDTHYGYKYDETNKTWVVDQNSTTSLYQVPVIKADLTKVMIVPDDHNTPDVDESVYENYGYGTYSVELYIAPSFLAKEPGYWSADFYLDSIRVYNPAGYDGTYDYQYHAVKRDDDGNPVYENGQPVYELVTKTSNGTVIKDAHKNDGEAWPTYTELRNLFIKQKELSAENTEGILFIDGKGSTAELSDYQSWGPNNEVYLNPGEHIAFTLDTTNYAQNVAGIHIGMRGLTGMGNVVIKAGESADDAVQLLNTQLSTTDLYFDISAKDADGNLAIGNKVVVISNPAKVKDADGNEVDNTVPISITNVKVTHTDVPEYKTKMMFCSSARTAQIALEILAVEDLVEPIVTPERPALSFNGMISYNVFFNAENLGELNAADLGLAVFSTEDTEGTIETAREVIMGASEVDGQYMISTSGVHAKYLGDKQYFRVFAKTADGSYIYSKMVSYSAVDYARNVLAKSSDVKLKQLVVAMLNYGAEAQKFFGYNTDDLMNRLLTADDQALLAGFDANSLNTVGKVDASKVGVFASNGGFTKKAPAISFKGAFEINYFFTPANAVDSDMKLYFWNEDTYNSVTELTAENADKVVDMTLENGSYTASSDEIAAKYLDKTVYVAAVYEHNGQTYCSGVLPYSIAAYCQNPPATVQDLATAAAIYGCTAKQYFGV